MEYQDKDNYIGRFNLAEEDLINEKRREPRDDLYSKVTRGSICVDIPSE